MMTREDREKIKQLVASYNSKEHSYEENIQFAVDMQRQFPFSCFSILRGKRFKKFWDDVVARTHFLDKIYSSRDISRLHYYVNKLEKVIVCSADGCNEPYTKKITPKELSKKRFYCNSTCAQRDSEVKKRIRETKEENHTTTKDLLEKTKERNRREFGCDWYFQSDDFCQKKLETWNNNGYDHPMHSEEVKAGIGDRYFEEHGVRHAFQDPEVQDKIHKTNMENLGAPTPMQSDNFRQEAHMKSTQSKLRTYFRDVIVSYEDVEPMFDEDFYVEHRESDFEFMWKCKLCGDIFNAPFRWEPPRCYKCKPKISGTSTSALENEVFEFVQSIESPYKCFFNQPENWNVLTLQKQQLDIVCNDPQSGKTVVAFEVNGIYWHSTDFKPHNYHLNKTRACEKMGIKLVHIWEDEWLQHRDETKELIRSVLLGNMPFAFDAEQVVVPRDKVCKSWNIAGYSVIGETSCRVVARGDKDRSQTFLTEDCGTLIFKKLSS